LDKGFGIFPEPSHAEGWKAAMAYVSAGAKHGKPVFHPEFIPGKKVTDKKTKKSVTVPGSDLYYRKSSDPYQDVV